MTSEIIAARNADGDDLAFVADLRALAVDEARPQRGGEMLLDFDRADADASAGQLVVGTLDGAVVGYARITNERSGDREIVMVHEVFVHPQARRVGVASAVLGRIIEIARAEGVSHVESEVLPGNRDAKNFFERAHMVTRKMRVSTPVD